MEIGEKLHGFAVRECTELPELSGRLWQLEHEKSGARLAWLDRAEENKTFGIAFRTLPEDDTGVFHILEHSVLNGSERYPVREPFVELLKSSMKTFLNAMTFPDKTFYPVSSRNPKDFLNLLRVYMDAVLHPLIYTRPEIFRQEGWHFEMPKDGGAPVYKGVVFNEMKGAFADPDTRLVNAILGRLFPDTSYRFESGGDPAHIPELTYEQFLASHQRFYHPSNSYIFLDGQLELGGVLAVLDGEYLSAYGRRDDQPEFVMQAPVKSGLARVYYEIGAGEPAENKARLAWGRVLGDFTCREELTAMQAMADALCGGSQSPLKRRLVSGGLAQDVVIQVLDGILQPFVMVEARNIDENRADEVEQALREELERLVREGLDHEQLAATLANLEFQMRERDYGSMPQGLVLGMSALESWLYGGHPAANLEAGALFASLGQKLEEGWFEALLARTLLDNPHSCQVLLLPSAALGEEERAAEAARLRDAAERWTAADRAELEEQQAKLDAFQSAQDTPEALATLPVLSLSDISPRPEDLPLEESALGDVPLLRHAVPTAGVGYVNLYFDVSDVEAEELPCLALLCAVLDELDTWQHTSLELQKLRRLNIGALRLSVEPYGRVNRPEECRTFLHVAFSALEGKLDPAAALVAELLTSARLDDRGRLRELLRQNAARMEQSVAGAGNVFAATRVAAGCSAEGAVRERVSGVTCCQWLKELEKDFDARADGLVEGLEALRARVFTAGRLTVSVTGVEDACAAALERALLPVLPLSERRALPCAVRPWGVRREGIVIPADVSFAALGGSLLPLGASYDGTLRVAGKAVTLDYLWNAVRVQGGAYGAGLVLSDGGSACFYSYRDPAAARSLGCYRQAADFLREFCGEKPDLTGLIIGAVADSEPLLTPSRKGQAADQLWFKGVTYADRCRRREEMLAATPDKLAAFARPLEELARSGGACVIGSKALAESCGMDTTFAL